jgi:hypothetical protein
VVSKRRSQAPRRLRSVDLSVLSKQCRTILAREVERLLDASFVEKLSKDDTASLMAYMKFLPDLKKQETAELDALTDDQLAAIAKDE